ncbi:conserved hypothetical protein [Mesorhizobium prunaredense]|uniref:Uncharacterized protein n=1 Tax=Mesorhizobium prunaredense TaxID=1631249 RepID=A0A1R3V8C6_9HYPH|nr:hypothetical protein [Mesorhizobium prunaredense]SIT56152.1 conserved hypothetical protein [Mesorhizobium prunaredense]
MTPHDQLAALRRINRRAELWDEAGQPLVFLPGMNVRHAERTVMVDGLLCPRGHSGYTTRLFLSQAFPNRGQNWTVHQILGRVWHTMSFNNVPASLRWTEILANHLGPLK